MAELPKIYTQEDQTKKDVETLKSGSDREMLLLLLRSFSQTRSLPTTDNYVKVHKEATDDFNRRDYSEAQSHVDTLVQLVEFYKELAETYLDNLNDHGIETDEYGSVSNHPFVLMKDGEQVLGSVELLDYDEQTATANANEREGLWTWYVKPYLQLASDYERGWIVEHFPEEVAALESIAQEDTNEV